ncbi:MAG: zinc ribbon domain-containing protein, partial [Chloroflexus sp.]
MNCPQCGSPVAPGTRFCTNCGYRLTPATPPM